MAIIAADVAHGTRVSAHGNSVLLGQSQREQLALNLSRQLLLLLGFCTQSARLFSPLNEIARLLNELRIRPGLLDEIRRTALQCLDCELDRTPGGDDQNGNIRVDFANTRDQVEPFASGSGIECVVQISDQQIELTGVKRFDHRCRMTDRLRIKPLQFQQKSNSVQNIGLIVSNEYTLGPRGDANSGAKR